MNHDVLQIENPYDGETIGEIPKDDAASLAVKLGAARGAFLDRGKWLSVPERIEVLETAQDLMRLAESDLALLIAREGGKPLRDAQVEVSRAIGGVGLCIEQIRSHVGERIPIGSNRAAAGRLAFTDKEPIGVVAAVSAFNHPLNLIVHQVAPAVAAGCPVLVKPAPDTPLSCLEFVKTLHRAGLPNELCQSVITDELDVAELLVKDPGLGFFTFIGSASVGWMLKNKVAPGVRCALEHGGAAPVVLCDDVDLSQVVPLLVKGGYYHAGQVCVSVQRVFVPRRLSSEFVERFVVAVAELEVGDPMWSKTEVGPLIRPQEVTRVDGWVQDAIREGAQCVLGGLPITERVYAPTILLNPSRSAAVSRNEIFGPVVCVYEYDDEDTAIQQANELPVAFQAAVFTQSIDNALRIAGRLAASAVMVNDHTAFRDDAMPFAGLRQSGLGVGGIPHTIKDMQIDKMIVFKSPALQ